MLVVRQAPEPFQIVIALKPLNIGFFLTIQRLIPHKMVTIRSLKQDGFEIAKITDAFSNLFHARPTQYDVANLHIKLTLMHVFERGFLEKKKGEGLGDMFYGATEAVVGTGNST